MNMLGEARAGQGGSRAVLSHQTGPGAALGTETHEERGGQLLLLPVHLRGGPGGGGCQGDDGSPRGTAPFLEGREGAGDPRLGRLLRLHRRLRLGEVSLLAPHPRHALQPQSAAAETEGKTTRQSTVPEPSSRLAHATSLFINYQLLPSTQCVIQ